MSNEAACDAAVVDQADDVVVAVEVAVEVVELTIVVAAENQLFDLLVEEVVVDGTGLHES